MFTDFRGTEITPGRVIVYNVKGSTSIATHEAVVVSVDSKPHPWSEGKLMPSIKVRPTGRTSQSWRSHVGRKRDTVTLTNIKNLVVLP